MIAFHFGPAERPMFGLFHAAEGDSGDDRAVLLCNPFGQEAINYAWRHGAILVASSADETSMHPMYPANLEHTLTVDAQCNPCTVEVGGTSKLTATAQDSIGCVITYQWSAPTGSFANPAQQNTAWTAPNTPGTVPVTVTGTCPTDSMKASDTVNIQVVPRVVKTMTFEDVYFDFDRYTLTDAAQRILAQAVEAMRADPTLRVRIEGHTCSIGTAEYNLALGDRRARSVQQYLVSNGIAADRLTTVSFGEEQPKYDNSREETRRLNRRAAMTVQLVAGN